MSKADEFRKEARAAEERAEKATSLKIAALERKRAEGFYTLAENEDWLEDERAVAVAGAFGQRLKPAKNH